MESGSAGPTPVFITHSSALLSLGQSCGGSLSASRSVCVCVCVATTTRPFSSFRPSFLLSHLLHLLTSSALSSFALTAAATAAAALLDVVSRLVRSSTTASTSFPCLPPSPLLPPPSLAFRPLLPLFGLRRPVRSFSVCPSESRF